MADDGTHRWDPDLYLRHADERGRPFVELLARVRADVAARRVVDLGCGPGNLTAPAGRSGGPRPTVHGLDSSPEMVAAARAGRTAGHGSAADLRGRRPPVVGARGARGRDRQQRHPPVGARTPRAPARAPRAPRPRRLARLPGPRQRARAQHAAAAAARRGPALRAVPAGVADIAAHDPEDYLEPWPRSWPDQAAPWTCGRRRTCTCWPGRTRCSTGSAAPAPARCCRRSRRRRAAACAQSSPPSSRRPCARRTPPRGHGTVLPFRRVFVVAQK